MLKKIMNIITLIGFIILTVSLMLYNQTSILKITILLSLFITMITASVSDYLEDKEEREP